jgi:hypothetical protein
VKPTYRAALEVPDNEVLDEGDLPERRRGGLESVAVEMLARPGNLAILRIPPRRFRGS